MDTQTTSMADDQPTPKEVMAAWIAHDLEDGQWVEVGANLAVPRAGALLAHFTRGPNMTVMMAMTKAHVYDEPFVDEYEYITDVRAMRYAEAYYQHDILLSHQRHRRRGVFFCGGIQLDQYGNSNLIGIGSDYKKLNFRGPGAIGTTNATAQSGRWHLITLSHDPRTLVEKVDYISAVGYGNGEKDFRRNLGLENDGPSSIITPLCIFGFDPETRRAVPKSLHPGVSLEEVIEKTGFRFPIPAEPLPVTRGPTPEELHVLRTRIDRHGGLR
jgi:glutaconate CoA-transferase, subunit B